MQKLATTMLKVSHRSATTHQLLNALACHGQLEGSEKIACENQVLVLLEKEANAFTAGFGQAWQGLKQLPGVAKFVASPNALQKSVIPGMADRAGLMGKAMWQGTKNWAAANPYHAGGALLAGGAALGHATGSQPGMPVGMYPGMFGAPAMMGGMLPMRKMGSDKTANFGETAMQGIKAIDWKSAIAGGMLGMVPPSILAAIGYMNLKKDMATRDAAVQQQLGGMNNDIASVGAATNMLAMNQMMGGMPGQDQQGQGGPDYATYSPEDFNGMKMSSLNEKFASLCELGSQVDLRDQLLVQTTNPELSKEAQDLACELLDINRSKIVECLKGIVA